MYQKRVTLAKAAVPSAVIIGGGKILEAVANRAGIPIDGESSFVIVTAIYSAVRGLLNWIKNRRR